MDFNYRFALVRPIPHSFEAALHKHPPLNPINTAKAMAQHGLYTKLVETLVPQVISVAESEAHPDCCFIEDTAFVFHKTILIARSGAKTRQGENQAVEQAFRLLQVRDPSFQIHRLPEDAILDGGDVLVMADQIFVGLSERTNRAALQHLQKLFPGRTHPVAVQAGLHLKSVLSAADHQTLLLAADPDSHEMAAQIQQVLDPLGTVRLVSLPDRVAANVLRIRDTLVIQAGFPRSETLLRALANELSLECHALDMSELIKADGALTCCSILIP